MHEITKFNHLKINPCNRFSGKKLFMFNVRDEIRNLIEYEFIYFIQIILIIANITCLRNRFFKIWDDCWNHNDMCSFFWTVSHQIWSPFSADVFLNCNSISKFSVAIDEIWKTCKFKIQFLFISVPFLSWIFR